MLSDRVIVNIPVELAKLTSDRLVSQLEVEVHVKFVPFHTRILLALAVFRAFIVELETEASAKENVCPSMSSPVPAK